MDGSDPIFDPIVGEYVWPSSTFRHQIPQLFLEPFRLSTAKTTAFQAVLMICFVATAAYLKISQSSLGGHCNSLSVLLFIQVALWAISFILHHHYSKDHAALRMVGHTHFSISLERKSSYLFYILTSSVAANLLHLGASIKYAPSPICDWEVSYSALNLTTYSILIYGVLFLIAVFNYIRVVRIFNAMDPIPDTIAANCLTCDNCQNIEEIDMLKSHVVQQSHLLEFYKNLLHDIARGTALRISDPNTA